MLNEIGDTEGAKAARVKLKEQRKAYRTYCDEHELTQRSDRLTVSKGSVSAAKAQKPLDNGGGSGIIISEKQFGKKIGKHAEDYGLDASKEEDRQKMKEIINDIHDNRTEIRTGQFCGQSGDVDFFIKGNDVVICKPNNEFITIMKDGANNDWVKNARKR